MHQEISTGLCGIGAINCAYKSYFFFRFVHSKAHKINNYGNIPINCENVVGLVNDVITKGCTDWVRAVCSLRRNVQTSCRTLPASYTHQWKPRGLPPMVQRLRSEVEQTYPPIFLYFNICIVHLLLFCTMTNNFNKSKFFCGRN